MPLFTGLIKCHYCGSAYKSKKEKGVRKYVCSSYDNGRGCKSRLPVEEDFLLELIEGRYEKTLAKEELQHMIDYIEVIDRKISKTTKKPVYKLNIFFKNGDKPIILEENYLQL
jgi:Recombinase zinc beta ribbon domain